MTRLRLPDVPLSDIVFRLSFFANLVASSKLVTVGSGDFKRPGSFSRGFRFGGSGSKSIVGAVVIISGATEGAN